MFQRLVRNRSAMKTIAFVAVGGLLGYLYYRFVGCKSGVCPITSNPYISILYGAAMGFIMGRG